MMNSRLVLTAIVVIVALIYFALVVPSMEGTETVVPRARQ